MTNMIKPNGSFSHPTDFVVNISLVDDKSNQGVFLNTYIQQFETPVLTKSVVNKRKGGAEVTLPTNVATKTDITINLIVDAEFLVYTTLLDLFHGKLKLDGIVLFLCNEGGIPLVAVDYVTPSLINVGSLSFDTTIDGAQTLTLPIEISYAKYEYERISV